jgi:uncharacterized protein YlxW (UPF0749 family)
MVYGMYIYIYIWYGNDDGESKYLAMCAKEMEQNFNQLSGNNIQLRKEKGELGVQLRAAGAQKAALEKEVAQLKTSANSSAKLHQAGQKKLVSLGVFLEDPLNWRMGTVE